MTDYILLLLITMARAWCADHISFGPVRPGQRHRLILCTLVILILLGSYAGLRTRCNDTGAYRHGYELITEEYWDATDKSVGANPLFNWTNYQLWRQGVSTQNFLMFWAFLTVGCYLIFLHRYSSDYPLTIFLLFTTGCYSFAFAGIKQAAAVGIAVLAVMFALRRKWLPFIAGVLVASLIHPYALMYLLVPFMEFRPWTKKTYFLLVAALLCGFFLRPLIGTVVNITTLLGEEYTLMVNLTMLNGAIMFVGLFGTANYFGRLANYFLIFQSLSLPWMLKKIGGQNRRILTWLMLLGYTGYFLYANLINQPFDQNFSRLTVEEYLTLSRS